RLADELKREFSQLVLQPLLAPISQGLAGRFGSGGSSGGSSGGLNSLGSLFTGGQAAAGAYGSFATSGIGQSLGLATEFAGPPTAAGLGSIGLTALGS